MSRIDRADSDGCATGSWTLGLDAQCTREWRNRQPATHIDCSNSHPSVPDVKKVGIQDLTPRPMADPTPDGLWPTALLDSASRANVRTVTELAQSRGCMGHSILIIDDDAGTRGLVTRLLQSEGYDTSVAENGAEAGRRRVEVKPCVILLDFEMPVMDGHDFREVQKRVAPDVPIICVTGAADAEQT